MNRLIKYFIDKKKQKQDEKRAFEDFIMLAISEPQIKVYKMPLESLN